MQGCEVIITIIIAYMITIILDSRHALLFFSFHTILTMAADQLIEKMSH